MELDREARKGVQKVEEKVYQGTSANNTWPRQKNEDRSRYVRLCSRRMLQLRNLSVGLGEESCIGFTQENSMENSLQELSLLIYVVTLVL